MKHTHLFILITVLMFASSNHAIYHWKAKKVTNEQNPFVFPGTNWCGKGNNAMGYDDLGEHRQTDACCRDHDHCPNTIPPFSSRFGITNIYPMYMSHCSCETKLFDCLWNVTSSASIAVGRMYFNVFRAPCFKLVEIRVCVRRSFDWWKFKTVCKEYGIELKAIAFRLKRFLKQYPVYHRNTTAVPYTTR